MIRCCILVGDTLVLRNCAARVRDENEQFLLAQTCGTPTRVWGHPCSETSQGQSSFALGIEAREQTFEGGDELFDPPLGTGERGHYKRSLFTGGISIFSKISRFSRIFRTWTFMKRHLFQKTPFSKPDPPLHVEDPHPTARSPDPKSKSLCPLSLPDRSPVTSTKCLKGATSAYTSAYRPQNSQFNQLQKCCVFKSQSVKLQVLLQKLQRHRQKIAEEIAAKFLRCGKNSHRFCIFKIAAFRDAKHFRLNTIVGTSQALTEVSQALWAQNVEKVSKLSQEQSKDLK